MKEVSSARLGSRLPSFWSERVDETRRQPRTTTLRPTNSVGCHFYFVGRFKHDASPGVWHSDFQVLGDDRRRRAEITTVLQSFKIVSTEVFFNPYTNHRHQDVKLGQRSAYSGLVNAGSGVV